ncbi:MAG: DUF2585 family protein [Pyrinomonadaceae bacterium]
MTALVLRAQGRLWQCACGHILLWAGNVLSADNSQHLLDPYSFTHALHGFVFCGLLAWAAPRLAPMWQLCLAVLTEAVWEIIENSAYVIKRYREATAALGYEGDTIVNSLSDIALCGLGFVIAKQLGWRRSLALFAITELVLLWWIKDNLTLNVLMLIYPVAAIKKWQMG